MLAAALLTVVSFHALFAGTVVGFLASAALVVSVALPSPSPFAPRGIYDRTTRGARIYLATPRAAGTAGCQPRRRRGRRGMVIVISTVVIVQGEFGLPQRSTALALAAVGGGSMLTALALPRLLDVIPDRTALLTAVLLLVFGLLAGVAVSGYTILLALWFVLGLGYSAAQLPSGRLLRRSSRPEDRPALFAAQFALSHACWLMTYPLAGWLGVSVGLSVTFVILACTAAAALAAAMMVWPTSDPEELPREHPEPVQKTVAKP